MGSFVATLVIRWPAGRSIADGRSRCDACDAKLRAHELVPILSYLALRRCRRCAAPIDPRHFVIEAAAALIGAASLAAAPGAAGMAGALFGWLLLASAALDAEHYWLPDALTLPLAGLGLAAGALGVPPAPLDRLLATCTGYLAFRLIGFGYARLRGRRGLGGGDAKLFAAIGATLGLRALPAVLFVAALAGLATVGLRRLRGREVSRFDRLPLGLFLAAAAWPAWLLQQLGGGTLGL